MDRIGRARPGPGPLRAGTEDVMNMIHTLADVFHSRVVVRHLGRAALTATMISFAAATAATAQQSFKTPQEAVETFVTAVRAGDRKAVNAILGPGAEQIISSGDAVQDENTRKVFLAAYDAQHSVRTGGDKPATLLIGPDDFPFAIPIAKKGDSWIFDTVAGRQEVLARRIGRNELDAIQVCLAYYDAQYEYAETMPKVDDLAVYAQRVVSRPGQKDGLYWPSAEGQLLLWWRSRLRSPRSAVRAHQMLQAAVQTPHNCQAKQPLNRRHPARPRPSFRHHRRLRLRLSRHRRRVLHPSQHRRQARLQLPSRLLRRRRAPVAPRPTRGVTTSAAEASSTAPPRRFAVTSRASPTSRTAVATSWSAATGRTVDRVEFRAHARITAETCARYASRE